MRSPRLVGQGGVHVGGVGSGADADGGSACCVVQAEGPLQEVRRRVPASAGMFFWRPNPIHTVNFRICQLQDTTTPDRRPESAPKLIVVIFVSAL